MNKKMITLEKQLHEIELDIPENWRGDIRNQLIQLFAPLMEGSEYEIRKNEGDSTKYILDLFHKGDSRRSMGFGTMKGMNFKIFPVRSFYEELVKKYPLPEPDPNKSQPHMKLSLKQMWELMSVISGSNQFFVYDDSDNEKLKDEMYTLEEEIEEISAITGDEKISLVKTRINQGVFRKVLLRKYGRCILCGVSNEKLLRASHIKPWKDASPEEKVDVNNGFMMCPNHDLLFDQGWISFDTNGKIVISNELRQDDCTLLNIHKDMKIDISDENLPYLEFHRTKIFKDKL